MDCSTVAIVSFRDGQLGVRKRLYGKGKAVSRSSPDWFRRLCHVACRSTISFTRCQGIVKRTLKVWSRGIGAFYTDSA